MENIGINRCKGTRGWGKRLLLVTTLGCAVVLPMTVASQPRATRGILEAAGGVGIADGFNTTTWLGGTLGYGGRFSGFPVRFYLVSSLLFDRATWEIEQPMSYAHRTGESWTWVGGIRCYIPLNRLFRVHLGAEAGVAWSDTRWQVNDLEQYHPTDTAFAMRYSGGVQARFHPNGSLGITLERNLFWGRKNDPAVAVMTGFSQLANQGDQFRVGITATIHF